jgi:hypothetical protein
MLERLVDYFLTQPKRLVGLGQALAQFGGFLLVGGVIANAATKSLSVVRGMVGDHTESTLADLLPGLPTWWVPESAVGFALAVLLTLAGVVALHTGRLYERALR